MTSQTVSYKTGFIHYTDDSCYVTHTSLCPTVEKRRFKTDVAAKKLIRRVEATIAYARTQKRIRNFTCIFQDPTTKLWFIRLGGMLVNNSVNNSYKSADLRLSFLVDL